MAGSYNHATDRATGKLYIPEHCVRMAAENGGDAYETIEEMYGMIWYLADQIAQEANADTAGIVEQARQNYQTGLLVSPGTDGELDPEDE